MEVSRPAWPDAQKKTAHASEQERPDVKAARENWIDGQRDLDPARLIFIDESVLSTKMARLRGWAPKGERCRAAIPHGHWKTVTFVGGLTLTGFVAPMLLDGRGTESASWPRSSRCWRLPCTQATSSSWTIWPPTRWWASGKLLKPAAPNSAICRPTVPTSIRSKMPSQSSRRMCENQPRAPSTHSNEPPPMPCHSSNPTIAQTSSITQDTAWINRNLL